MTTPAMRPLEPLIGRWHTSGTVLDEHGATVMTIRGTDEYEWMVGGHWMIHRADVIMGDQRGHTLELIGEHDAVVGNYLMRAFEHSGGGVRDDDHASAGGWVLSLGGRRRSQHPEARRGRPGDDGALGQGADG